MSADKPTGGDDFPERFSMRDDRPFPGAPENREPAPELPKNPLSMDELRAVYERSNSLAELQAEARAYEEAQALAAGSSDSSGQGSPDSVSVGEEPAEAGGDDAVPLDARPGVQDAVADEAARAGQPEDLPPSPGAPEGGELTPELPDSAPSMNDLRVMHQEAASNAELEAMAAEHTAAQKEASAPGPGREQGLHDSDGFFGQPGDLQDQGTTEPGERDADERTGPGTGTSADTSTKPGQSGETGGEKDGEGQVEDGQDQKPRDLVQRPAPHAETDRPAEAAAEAAPDQQPDDPRITAMERQMERMMATVEAMQEKLEASEEIQNELRQEIGDLKTENKELREKAGELGSAAETGRQDRPDPPDTGERTEPDGVPDVTEQERFGLHGTDDATASDIEQADVNDIDESRIAGSDREAPRISERSILSPEDAELAKSAAGVLGSLGVSIPGMDLLTGGDSTRQAIEKMSPEGQLRAMRMAENFGILSSSMPPETAAVAFAASLLGPGLYVRSRDSVRDFVQKIRPKE